MADNPKSLASLADDLERHADFWRKLPDGYCRCEKLDAKRYPDGSCDFCRGGDNIRKAAAALRAPTIAVTDAEAADADSVEYANKVQSNLSRPDAFVWMIARNAYLAGRAALATPSPTIAAPSPSNEVTPEMVEAAQRVPLNVSGRTYLRLVIEAALKARKPADEGADDGVVERAGPCGASLQPERFRVTKSATESALEAFLTGASRTTNYERMWNALEAAADVDYNLRKMQAADDGAGP